MTERDDAIFRAGTPRAAEFNEELSRIDKWLTPRVFNIEMSGGHSVRAYEVGPPDVPAVIGCHGTVGVPIQSGGGGIGYIARYVSFAPLFCRLIAFDRPGYGGSSPQPGRKVGDIAPIVEAILDHLSVDVAGVFGTSGGGPSALATAALLPRRISRAASYGGVGPSFGPGGFDFVDGSAPLFRAEIEAARKGEKAAREFYRNVIAGPPRSPENDYSALEFSLQSRSSAAPDPVSEKITQQLALPVNPYPQEDAYVDDVLSWCAPWGFELGSIKAPTRFFHGLEDVAVSPRHPKWMKSQIPNASLELYPHIGHALDKLMPHVLAWLTMA
ncbi:alpha/beta hydrolase [Mesorhizobium sp. M0047]|uniref:alpha/beta fold hydrolase n=1 Tax=Mesorhizobium sp. M0047 TaxID=2956859 RepID=UPI003337954B